MKVIRGFTLIELMVTIAVLAILATLTAPSLENAIKKREIESTGNDFEKALSQARADAVLYRKNVTVNIKSKGPDTDTTRFWSVPEDVTVEFKEGRCEDGRWNNEKTIPVFSQIVFLPQGTVQALPNNLEVQLKNEHDKKFIYVTNLGRISISNNSIFEGACTI
jgi:type II secretion system protein H